MLRSGAQLVSYSLEFGFFSDQALLDSAIHYVRWLMEAEKNEQALRLIRKVTKQREKRLRPLNKKTLEAYHLLPIVLNNLYECEEAIEVSRDLSEREEAVFGNLSAILMETKAEKAKALFQLGEIEAAD